MAVSAAILCLAFCVCDVTNKSSMCDKSVHYVTYCVIYSSFLCPNKGMAANASDFNMPTDVNTHDIT